MWNLATLQASRVGLRRIFMQAAAILVVALFANTLLAPSAMAADATWNGTTLTYNGQTLQPDSTLPNRPNEPHEYVYRDSSVTPPTATMLYFGGNDPTQATSATLVTCTYTNTPGSPGSWSYVNCSQPQTVNAIPVTAAPPKQAVASSCDASVAQGVGWLVCSLSNYIAGGVDNIYTIIRDFLEVQPVLETNTKTNKPSGIYQLWDVIRTIANVCFVIAFLVIIYSQITGAGISNYGLKDMIPRLIVAALLVNVSFWIAALAVDASNIIGHNIYAIVENIKSSMTVVGGDVSWPVITTFILSAGTVGTLGFAVAAGGSVASLGFILLAALISAAVSVLVAFIILAARQALITVMIAIAPLAFVAYLLPNTRSLFSKWGKSFMTLLLFFPIFALLFGGSQLAGAAIIDNAGGRLHIVLVGLATQFVPLVITPLIIRFSSGLLGQIANMTNNSSRGLIDRARGWATDNADMWAARKRAKTAGDIERRQNGEKVNPFRARGIGRLAYGLDQSKRRRDAYKKTSEDMLQATHERQWNRRMNEPSEGLVTAQRNFARIHHQTHQIHKQAGEEKAKDDAHAEQQWVSYLGSTAGSRYRDMRSETLLTTNSTKALDEAMTAADQRTFDTLVAQASPTNDNGYLQIRRAKEQSVTDTQHAQFQASEVQAAGEREFRRAFEDGVPGSRDLRQQNVRIERMKKESSTIANTLQKRADADWERVSQTNVEVKTLRLKEVEAIDSQRAAEAQWSDVVEDIRLNGGASTHVSGRADLAAARSIQRSVERVTAAEQSAEAKKSITQSRARTTYIESIEGQRLSAMNQAAKDTLSAAETTEESRIQELRTEEGAKGLTGEEAAIAQELHESYVVKRAQSQRGNIASSQADQEYAKHIIDDDFIPGGTETIAEIAGGIAGDAGVSQAKATAKQTVVEGFNKGVASERTLLSQVREQTILGNNIDGEPGLGSPDILDESEERIAALASTIAGRYHMASHIKLWDRMGELRRQASAEMEAANTSGDADAIARAKAKVSKVKSMEQQVMGDKTKTPFGIGDQEQGAATVGDFEGDILESTRDRILTHVSAQSLANMDPDDLYLFAQMGRDGKLSQAHLDKINAAYEEWEQHPTLGASLADKHRRFLEPLRIQAETGDRSRYDLGETRFPDVSRMSNA